MKTNGWKICKLSDCVSFHSGGTPQRGNQHYWNGDIPWVTSKDMKIDYIYDSQDHLTRLGLSNGSRIAPKGSILIVVRSMILAKQFPIAIVMRHVSFNQDLKAIECKENIDNKFLFYLLKEKSYDILGLVDEAAHGTKRIQMDRLENLEILLPPLDTQKDIASCLSVYDNLIENNKSRIQLLEKIVQLIYREWFIRFNFPGHDKVNMVDSTKGMIPEGWRIKNFSEIAVSVRNNINPQKFPNEKFAHYSIPAFDATKMPILEFGKDVMSNKLEFKFDCILLSKLNPHIPRVWMPNLNDQYRSIASSEFLVLTPKNGISTHFLYCMCQSGEFYNEFSEHAIGTSTSHQRVKPDDLYKLPVLVPCTDTIKSFTGIIKPIFNLINNLKDQNIILKESRDIISSKIFSSELDL